MTENTTAPVEPQSTEQPAQVSTEVANPENLQPGTEQAPEPAKDEGKAARDAMQRRINRLTAEKYQERAQREQLERQLQTQQQPSGEQPQIPRELVEREARRIAAEQSFNQQCTTLVEKGRAEFPNFDAQLTNLAAITGPLLNDRGQAEPLLEAVLSTDAPHKVLQHLAANPDLAASLVDLSPIQQARKLALIEHQMSTKPIRLPSGAPKPLEPVSTASAGDDEPDPADTKRWIKWYDKQKAKNR